MSVPHGDPSRFWSAVEQAFLSWETTWSPARWKPWRAVFSGREGLFVLLRGIALGGALALVSVTTWQTAAGDVLRSAAIGLALLLLFDILVVHASIAFVSRRPANLLRSVVLALLSFFEIPLSFAVFYQSAAECFSTTLTWDRAIYFSVVTATTLGYGDIAPKLDARFVHATVVGELFASVTFLSVLIARLIGLTTVAGQEGPGGLKAMAVRDVEQAVADERPAARTPPGRS